MVEGGWNEGNMESGIKSILLSLYQENIIDEKTKKEIESQKGIRNKKLAIFQLIEKCNWQNSKRIVQLIQEAVTTRNTFVTQETNPMKINHIIKHVMEFLEYSDLSNCRKVCEKWNTVADPMLKKFSRIIFCDHQENHGLRAFLDSFPVPLKHISHFTFQRTFGFSVSDLSRFFELYRSGIEKLEFTTQLHLQDDEGKDISIHDMCSCFSGCNITHLNISGNRYRTTMLLSLDAFPNVRNITLNACLIQSRHESKIKPVVIKFANVDFVDGTTILEDFRISDVVDFSETKEVFIDCTYSNHSGSIDVSEPQQEDIVNIDSMDLTCVEMAHLNESCWSVRKLRVSNAVFTGIVTMDIKSFTPRRNTYLDLFSLPPTLEELYLTDSTVRYDYNEDGVVHLPNLKHLSLCTQLLAIQCFANCGNLVELYLESERSANGGTLVTIKPEILPKTLKKVKLRGIDIHGNTPDNDNEEDYPYCKLSTLILDGYSLNDASEIDDILEPKVLVINWERGNSFEAAGSAAKFIRKSLSNVTILGPVVFKMFKHSPLSKMVDRRSNYYIVKDKRGTAIGKNDFEQFMDLKNSTVSFRFQLLND